MENEPAVKRPSGTGCNELQCATPSLEFSAFVTSAVVSCSKKYSSNSVWVSGVSRAKRCWARLTLDSMCPRCRPLASPALRMCFSAASEIETTRHEFFESAAVSKVLCLILRSTFAANRSPYSVNKNSPVGESTRCGRFSGCVAMGVGCFVRPNVRANGATTVGRQAQATE